MAIGLTFTTFFSLGLLLISHYGQHVDLDQNCVLYGNLIGIPFDYWTFQGYAMGPKAPYALALLLLGNGLFIFLGYPSLLLTSFDPTLAQSLGVPIKQWNQALMFATTLTSMLSFRIVGAPMVVALLVHPTGYRLAIKRPPSDHTGTYPLHCLFSSLEWPWPSLLGAGVDACCNDYLCCFSLWPCLLE